MIPKNTLQNFRLIDLGVQDYVANGGGGGRNYNYLSVPFQSLIQFHYIMTLN